MPKAGEAKARTVMREFKAGKLKSSSGGRVTDPKQAVAIAVSEAKRADKVPKGDSKASRTKRSKMLGDRSF